MCRIFQARINTLRLARSRSLGGGLGLWRRYSHGVQTPHQAGFLASGLILVIDTFPGCAIKGGDSQANGFRRGLLIAGGYHLNALFDTRPGKCPNRAVSGLSCQGAAVRFSS